MRSNSEEKCHALATDFPVTPAILEVSYALEAGPRYLERLGHGVRLQTLPVTSSCIIPAFLNNHEPLAHDLLYSNSQNT
jgi:hypothetical protein